MRRLAIASGAFSAAVFVSCYLLSAVWLLPLAALGILGGAALLLLKERWLRPGCIALFGLAFGFLLCFVHTQWTLRPAEALSGQEASFFGTVESYPVPSGEGWRVDMKLSIAGGPRLRAVVHDSSSALSTAIPGDRFACQGQLRRADRRYGERYDAYNARDIYLIANLSTLPQKVSHSDSPRTLALRINHRLVEKIDGIFPADTALFFKALLLGDKSDLYRDENLYYAMSRSGFMHIVAVSGMHVAFLVGLLQLMLGVGPRSSRMCLALVWSFVLLTGGSPSAVRAAFMQTTLLLAPLLRRENDPPTSLLASLGLVLLVNPSACTGVGLQLSFGSMAGLMLFAAPIRSVFERMLPVLERNHFIDYVFDTVASSLAVLIFTLPLSAIHFGVVQVLSPLSNLLALWCVPICFGGGYLACLLSFLWKNLGMAAAALLSWPARYLFAVAKGISAVDFAALYTDNPWVGIWLCVCLLLTIVFAVSRLRPWMKLLLPVAVSAVLLVLTLVLTHWYYASTTATFTVLDVGQGQCITAFAGDKTVMVDCGSIFTQENAGDVAGGWLRSCGRKRVDILLLTHLHTDHADGVCRLMHYVDIDTIVLSDEADSDTDVQSQILEQAAQKGIRIHRLRKDTVMEAGALRMRLFAPVGKGSVNERCISSVISYGYYDMLITGDMDATSEKALLSEQKLQDIELLIVGHHGSKYSSSTELLRAIGADTAVISSGYNTFGHPTPETLERLRDNGYTVHRTDTEGNVSFRVPQELAYGK